MPIRPSQLVLVLLTALSFSAPAVAKDPGKGQLEANKKTALAYYDLAVNQKDFDTAAARYLGPRYTQHNPTVVDGPAGIRGMIEFMKKEMPQAHCDTKHSAADGDLVWLHSHCVSAPGARGIAVVDIFRFENGKIIEHWDVIQDVPEKPVNTNGMF